MPLRLLACAVLLILGSLGGVLLLAGYPLGASPTVAASCASGCSEARHAALSPAERAERFARVFRQ